MGLGTSQGAYYDDSFHQAAAQWDPKYDTNEVAPQAIQDANDNPPPVTKANDDGKPLTKVYITGSDSAGDSTSTPKGTPENGYNTPLTPEEQKDYNTKFSPEDSQDYDMQGWYKANPTVDPHTDGTHYPDTYKKPNHPTFSDQSQYHSDDTQGGQWTTDDKGGDVFTPGPQNIKNGMDVTKDYLKRNDPKVHLNYMDPSSSSVDLPRAPFGVGSEGEIPEGTLQGKIFGDKLSGFLNTVKNAFKLSGDVYGGKIDPTSTQGIERSLDLASLMVAGPAPVAAKMADGTLGSFMGVKSKTFSHGDLAGAQSLERNGGTVDELWTNHGSIKMADGKWRQEIDDSKASLKDTAFDITPEETTQKTDPNRPGSSWTYIERGARAQLKPEYKSFFGDRKPLYLKDAIDHPELFKAYPELEGIKVEPTPPLAFNMAGAYSRESRTLYLAPGNPDSVLNTTLHEIQHAIQHIEGFEGGGNTQAFKSKEFGELVDQFTKQKNAAERHIIDQGVTRPDMDKMKYAIKAEMEGMLEDRAGSFAQYLHREYGPFLEAAKALGVYDKLKYIVEGEKSIQTMDNVAFTKYSRVMGEVEARNVEARRKFDDIERTMRTPDTTQDVPNFLQGRSPLKDGDANSEGIFKPYSPRWPNNDNVRPLNEHEQFIKDYDELHAFGKKMNYKSDIDIAKYNKMGRAMMKKFGGEWTDVPLGRLQDR